MGLWQVCPAFHSIFRHEKKVLALVLAFACAFTMFAGAASFTDEADIQALDAVNMLTTLGVIQGYEDNSFQPDGVVTRAEMAKMIFVVRNNTADDAAYANVGTSLTDISGHWAEGYIKFCESQGIIAGKGNGIFDPDATVTGTEAAKMLLVLTGYEADKAGLEGTAWATNTLKHAGAAGILNGVSSALESGLPRQWAAQMIYNTLSANRVVWSNDSNSFDDVLNGGVKETVGRAYMGLYASVGTLVSIDLDALTLANIDTNESDSTGTIWNSGKWNAQYESAFTKVTTDYSDLLGQTVKVMFKDANTSKVLGVFAVEDNTVYTVAANETSKSDDKVSFNGNSYRLDGNGSIDTYVDGQYIGATTLAQLDKNMLNPNMYTFIDSDGNGRLDTLVVKTYNVAKVSYAASDKIIAANQTYKYADENIADGIAKDDWVVITRDLFEDKWNVEKVDVQTATLDALRNNKSDSAYFDGAASMAAATYNEYEIGDEWLSGGDKLQSNRSENDLKTVKAGQTVDYVAVNGIVFSIAKSTGTNNGRVANVALVLKIDGAGFEDRVKLAFFDGSTKTVSFEKTADYAKVTDLNEGEVYEYSISGDNYRFYNLKQGVGGAIYEKNEGYYGDLSYRGNTDVSATLANDNRSIDDLANGKFDTMVIDDNAEILLVDPAAYDFVQITGKQFKTFNSVAELNNMDGHNNGLVADGTAAAYAFSGDMNGLDRIGALALEVDNGFDFTSIKSSTWTHYGFILSDAKWIVENKTMQYDLWTTDGLITVQEDYNNLTDRQARTAIGFDKLTSLENVNSTSLIMRAAAATHEIEGVDVLNEANTSNAFCFTAITDVSNNGNTVKFANGVELNVSDATILYVDSDGKTGIAEGSIKTAIKDYADRYLANAIYLPVGDDADLLIVDQLTYLKSDVHKAEVEATGGVIYGDNAITGNEKTAAIGTLPNDLKAGVETNKTITITTKNIANGTTVTAQLVDVNGDAVTNGTLAVANGTVSGDSATIKLTGTPATAGNVYLKVSVDGVTKTSNAIAIADADKTVMEQIKEAIATAFPANEDATGSKATPYALTAVLDQAAQVGQQGSFEIALAKYFEGYTVTAAEADDMNGLTNDYGKANYTLSQDGTKITIADDASGSTFANDDQFGIELTVTEDATGTATKLYALVTLDASAAEAAAAEAAQLENNALVATLTATSGSGTSFLHGANAVGTLEKVVKLVKDVSSGADVGTALSPAYDDTKVDVAVAAVEEADKPVDGVNLTGTFEKASKVELNGAKTAVNVTASTVSTSSAWTAYTLTVTAKTVSGATTPAASATYTVVVYGA